MEKRTQWYRGEQAMFARTVGVSDQYLCDILHCRKRALPELAKKIEALAEQQGLALTANDLMFPHDSTSPLIVKPA